MYDALTDLLLNTTTEWRLITKQQELVINGVKEVIRLSEWACKLGKLKTIPNPPGCEKCDGSVYINGLCMMGLRPDLSGDYVRDKNGITFSKDCPVEEGDLIIFIPYPDVKESKCQS